MQKQLDMQNQPLSSSTKKLIISGNIQEYRDHDKVAQKTSKSVEQVDNMMDGQLVIGSHDLNEVNSQMQIKEIVPQTKPKKDFLLIENRISGKKASAQQSNSYSIS